MKAHEFLNQAQSEMQDRATTYDKPEGERSMANTVAMFNALTGHSLTEEQGWKFMCCLKLVRSEQGEFKADNFVDGAAYFGLAGETAATEYAVTQNVTQPEPNDARCDDCGTWDSNLVGGLCAACAGKYQEKAA